MKQVTFTYNEREYSCSMEESTEALPYFYWCFFEDESLVQEIGDSITFEYDGTNLETTEIYPKKYEAMIAEIKEKEAAYIHQL